MRRRPIALAGALLAATLLAGCLIIPTDYYTEFSRKNTDQQPVAAIAPGKTTREETFLLLGEPDHASADEREVWYVAEKIKAILILGDRGGEVPARYLLIIRFDGRGVVESQRVAVCYDPIPDR